MFILFLILITLKITLSMIYDNSCSLTLRKLQLNLHKKDMNGIPNKGIILKIKKVSNHLLSSHQLLKDSIEDRAAMSIPESTCTLQFSTSSIKFFSCHGEQLPTSMSRMFVMNILDSLIA